MSDSQEIKKVKARVEKDLLSRPGVTGVDIGYKYVGGKKTDQIAIRVLVAKKRTVPEKERIPEEIEGVKTDVIERKYELHSSVVGESPAAPDVASYDPLRGGISLGPCRTIDGSAVAGTLGAVVRDNSTGDPMLLSNFHVMSVDDAWSVGDTMAQPSPADGVGCPDEIVGTLERASLGGQVDAAVAKHTARRFSCEIVDIGEVDRAVTAVLGAPVRKRGRTTGLTFGHIDSISLTLSLDYGNGLGVVTLSDQISIAVDGSRSPHWGQGGDSGSVVIDESGSMVGLYFAGTPEGDNGVANPIDAVFTALGVSACTPATLEEEHSQG